jgi:hypothetical protein
LAQMDRYTNAHHQRRERMFLEVDPRAENSRHTRRNDARCDSSSHARNVGGEEVNAVAVKVAAGAVLVLGGAGGRHAGPGSGHRAAARLRPGRW